MVKERCFEKILTEMLQRLSNANAMIEAIKVSVAFVLYSTDHTSKALHISNFAPPA